MVDINLIDVQIKRKNRDNMEMRRLLNKITHGVDKLNDFLDFMTRSLKYMESHGHEVEQVQRDAHDNCMKSMRDLNEKWEIVKGKTRLTRRNQSLRQMQIELVSSPNMSKTEDGQRDEEAAIDSKLREWSNELDNWVK